MKPIKELSSVSTHIPKMGMTHALFRLIMEGNSLEESRLIIGISMDNTRMVYKRVNEKIRYFRSPKGLSQKAFAIKIKISRDVLSKYEGNTSKPTINFFIGIAKCFFIVLYTSFLYTFIGLKFNLCVYKLYLHNKNK